VANTEVSTVVNTLIPDLLRRCDFPAPGTAVDCALSGGSDSSALIILAAAAGCVVTAHHVDHQIRNESAADAARAADIAAAVGVEFVLHTVSVLPGPNLEARARAARFGCLPDGVMTGHTAEDQAETVLMRLVRGAGSEGLSAMTPNHRHPILRLRRAETEAVCAAHSISWVTDASNLSARFTRNRMRAEVVPLLTDVARRDVVPLITRTADILRDESAFLDSLASGLDPTDAKALAAAPVVLARRALRMWLAHEGYPPDSATVERVLEVARGRHIACEIGRSQRVERHLQRLRVTPATR
jgi:tRNA(Ile)-lysidine synthase